MKSKIDWTLIFFYLFIGIVVAFALINVFWIIYAFVKYGGKPISEVPAWALFYMFGGRR